MADQLNQANNRPSDQDRTELLTLYTALADEIRETKTRAWVVTNYLVALHVAAIGYIHKLFDKTMSQCVLSIFGILSLLLCGFAIYLIGQTMCRNVKSRNNTVRVEKQLGELFQKVSGTDDREEYMSCTYDLPVPLLMMAIVVLTCVMFIGYLVHLC